MLATGLQALIGPFIITFAMLRPSLTPHTVMLISTCISAISLPINTLYLAAELPMLTTLLPKNRYGQFCSANALVRSIALIGGGHICGLVLDSAKALHPGPNYCYRVLPIWNFAFQVGSTLFFGLLYREWKKLGGKDHFQPPVAASSPTVP